MRGTVGQTTHILYLRDFIDAFINLDTLSHLSCQTFYCCRLEEKISNRAWLFLCEEETRLDVEKLTELLSELDHTKVCDIFYISPIQKFVGSVIF